MTRPLSARAESHSCVRSRLSSLAPGAVILLTYLYFGWHLFAAVSAGRGAWGMP